MLLSGMNVEHLVLPPAHPSEQTFGFRKAGLLFPFLRLMTYLSTTAFTQCKDVARYRKKSCRPMLDGGGFPINFEHTCICMLL